LKLNGLCLIWEQITLELVNFFSPFLSQTFFFLLGIGDSEQNPRVVIPSIIARRNPEDVSKAEDWTRDPPRIWVGEDGLLKDDTFDFWPFKYGTQTKTHLKTSGKKRMRKKRLTFFVGRLLTAEEWEDPSTSYSPSITSSSSSSSSLPPTPPLSIALENYFLHCIMNELREDPGKCHSTLRGSR
jgi:hypothetical protein